MIASKSHGQTLEVHFEVKLEGAVLARPPGEQMRLAMRARCVFFIFLPVAIVEQWTDIVCRALYLFLEEQQNKY